MPRARLMGYGNACLVCVIQFKIQEFIVTCKDNTASGNIADSEICVLQAPYNKNKLKYLVEFNSVKVVKLFKIEVGMQGIKNKINSILQSRMYMVLLLY